MPEKSPFLYEHRIKEIKEVYESLKIRYNLPTIDEIQSEFLIPLVEISPEPKMVLNMIIQSIIGRLGGFSREIQSILLAGNFCCSFERKSLSQEEKMKYFELYVKIQKICWEAKYKILNSEADSAKWLNDMMVLWKKELKTEIREFNKKFFNFWEKFKASEDVVRYFG